MKVRILVDVKRLGLACGQYADIDSEEAKNLIANGEADAQAPWPDGTETGWPTGADDLELPASPELPQE